MAQDIKDLLKQDQEVQDQQMPSGHESRFLEKLDENFPEHKRPMMYWLNIAASVVIVIALSFGGLKFFKSSSDPVNNSTETVAATKSLGDVSPDLKKVEDYYMANINLELSKVKLTPENKEMFDSFIKRFEDLKDEYNALSLELTENGPNEQTINALIGNLKLRLNLLHRLKEQLKTLNTLEEKQEVI